MATSRARRNSSAARSRTAPTDVFTIDTGTARIEAAREDSNAWTLYVNKQPSSPYHWDDPTRLDFPYLATFDTISGAFFPDAGARLHALHLGGAACSLARAWASRYPSSRHLVVDVDQALNELVRAHFDLPRSPVLKLRTGDALAVLIERADASSQLIVRDAFAGNTTPIHLESDEFFAHARRVLAPDGVLLLNIATSPPRSRLYDELARLGAHFAHVGYVAEDAVLKGRRESNVVAYATDRDPPSAAIHRAFTGGAYRHHTAG